MPKNQRRMVSILVLLFALTACDKTGITADSQQQSTFDATQPANHPVADDVLFLVLGKMALYDQSPEGKISLRNHHFVAEIMPKADRKIISGTLTSAKDESQVLKFEPEGNAFLAHGARVMNPGELHQLHPDGDYNFSYQTQSGFMDGQSINLRKRDTIEHMPLPAKVTLEQNKLPALAAEIDPGNDLTIAWEPMPGNTGVAASDLDDLVFVLVFDCAGENIAHSGRPYQGGPYLTYKESQFKVAATSLKPGQKYMAIVEQATADVSVYQGVPGIATYATLTFLDFHTTGTAEGGNCQ